MAIETYSHKVEDQTLDEFFVAASEHRMELEAQGMVLDQGWWEEATIGGVKCRTMAWPVLELARPALTIPPPANDDIPATDHPLVDDETDGPSAA